MKFREFAAELFSNWPVKLFSLAAAVILYFSFQIVSLDSKSFSLPLQVREGGNFVLTEQAPSYVRVTVRTKPDNLAAVQKTDIQAYIDTSSVTSAGINSLPIKLELKDFFTLMEPLDIEVKPFRLSLSFEKVAYKTVPLKPMFLGTPAEGFEVSSWTISPVAVNILGPESIVASTSEVYSSTVDLRDRKTGFKAPITVEKASKRIQVLDVPDVFIKVEMRAILETREFSNVSVYPLNLNKKLKPAADMQKVTIMLSGEKKVLDSFASSYIVVHADFTDISEPGIYSVPLRVPFTEDFSTVSIEPPVLKVELIENDFSSFPETDNDFSFKPKSESSTALALFFKDTL